MGALILLLLVTTRKLHQDAVARAQAEQALVQSQREAEEAASREAIPLPLPEDHPAFQTDAAEFVIAVPSPAKQLLPPAPPAVPDRTLEKEQLRREWASRLADLQKNWERLQQRLREGRTELNAKSQQEADLAAELARLQEAINKLKLEQGEIKQESQTAKTTKLSIAQQIAELQAELARLQSDKANQADKFQLVPYVGSSPTRRRPIIIECGSNSIRFASEDITLSARDMSGFSAEYNPVRAGTDALLAYWETQRQSASSLAAMQPEPYLLFVIRPGGTVSYYVTRRMLEGVKVDSGYELVTQSQELIWPVSTPAAKTACQEAIDEVLGVRNRMAGKLPDGRLPIDAELQYEGTKGEFILDEVQKLRTPQQKTFVGGQRITRHARGRSGLPGYMPPSAPDRGEFVGPRLEDLKNDFGNESPQRYAQVPRPDSGATPRGQLGRPFPTQPPPRTGGDGALADAGDPPSSGGPHGPVRKLKPGWKSQHPGTAVDPSRVQPASPEEIARLTRVPQAARDSVGNYGKAGRGAGESSGEATSQFGDEGEVNDLLSSTASGSHQRPSKPHDPTNDLSLKSQGSGRSTGDRTSAAETTDDLSLAGESQPGGIAGEKGAWSGAGGRSEAASDSVPVQPGSGGGPGGASSSGALNSGHPPDATEEVITKHVPRPLPRPSANSIAAERFIVVKVEQSVIEVGAHRIPIEEGMDSRDLEELFSQGIAAHSKRWGRPPVGFHWKPVVRFRVLPGGNQYYAWLQTACDDWEFRNTLEYVFD